MRTASMKCPSCAAVNQPGALACEYCHATLASDESLGDGARSLDARFDELAAVTARLLASQDLPPVTPATLHVAFARASENVARMRDVLDATARAIPHPSSPQEALVWLRRAPALAWVSYRALGYTRNFTLAPICEVLGDLYRDRGGWERRDQNLRAAFTQHERAARGAIPSLSLGLQRFARSNPLLALVLALASVGALWSFASRPSGGHARHARRHGVILIEPSLRPHRG